MSLKKLYIKTYGCQMNVYDSKKMEELLTPLGYEITEKPDDSNMVVLNTCHIRERAAEKVYSELGRIRIKQKKMRAKGKEMMIAVAGCVAQAEGEEVMKRAPYVDIVVGPQSYHHLPELIANAVRKKGGAMDLDFPAISKFDSLPVATSQGASAFLSIQEGCDKFCTFCVVPYTRGAEYSRRLEEIVREANRLVELGAKEVTLLGQNVNAYHGERPDGEVFSLAKLIKYLAKIKDLKRIRYMTSHPLDMDEELIKLHGEEEKLMPFLHLPVQSGSNRVLKMMNRKHNRDHYLKVIESLRKARSDIAFSSDFIVGFPGETERDFKDTLALIDEVGYAQAYSFKYSIRPGTPASIMDNQVPEQEKERRLRELQNLINKHQEGYNVLGVGKVIEVLFDRKGKLEGQILGRSPHMQSVYVNDAYNFGKIVPVKITEAHSNSLSGIIVA